MTCRISEDEHGNLKFECGPALEKEVQEALVKAIDAAMEGK